MKSDSLFTSKKIKTKLVLNSVLFCIFILASVLFSYKITNDIGRAILELVDTTTPAVRHATLTDMYHDSIKGSVYKSLYSRNNEKALAETRKEFAEYKENITSNLKKVTELELPSDVIEAAKSALGYIENYNDMAAKIIMKSDSATEAELSKFEEIFTLLEGKLDKFGDELEKYSDEIGARSREEINSGRRLLLLVLFISMFTSILMSSLFIKSIQKTLQEVIDNIDQSSVQIKTSSTSLSETANFLYAAVEGEASAIQETASSLEEIKAMSQKTQESSQELMQTSSATKKLSEKGRNFTKEMETNINLINHSNEDVMKQMEKSNEQFSSIVNVIGEINSKTKIINDIVFQTKLISFNASVEAARAGEQGKGFSVVAEEVGNLAQMSGFAAKEISKILADSLLHVQSLLETNKNEMKKLIDANKEKIRIGLASSAKCSEALNEISNQSKEMENLSSSMSAAIAEQNQGIHEISKALNLLEVSTHKNTSSANKTKGEAESLSNNSKMIESVIQEAKELI